MFRFDSLETIVFFALLLVSSNCKTIRYSIEKFNSFYFSSITFCIANWKDAVFLYGLSWTKNLHIGLDSDLSLKPMPNFWILNVFIEANEDNYKNNILWHYFQRDFVKVFFFVQITILATWNSTLFIHFSYYLYSNYWRKRLMNLLWT